MKTKNEQRSKAIQFGLKMLIGAIIGLSFGFGVGKMVKSNDGLVTSIEKNLQQNCNCKSVEASWSAVGIQFSKEDGFSNSRIEFTLENSMLTTSAEKEAMRLHTILKKNVDHYDSVDLIIFNFKSGEKYKTVKIKEGCIVEPELS